jgi:hypothetical protein
MKVKGYLIFHLNLAFSSIEENSRLNVIQKCYHPLLDLIEKTGIPMGVELTGWTLKQIKKADPLWIKRFKLLLDNGSCELIGSGYCQLIGPLVPFSVNKWNQEIGMQLYGRILGVRPKIALVNEMAYSSSLVALYKEFGYKGIIIDKDNASLVLKNKTKTISELPMNAQGVEVNISLPVLWSDSILFQKFQHYAHGDTSLFKYINYIKERVAIGDNLIPIYCSDAEVFDYRPGRFSEEALANPEGEWSRINRALKAITIEVNMEWVLPTEALNINNKSIRCISSKFTSAAHPIPVKKQAKYNISRWAVTGRDDLWLNTACHKIEKYLTMSNNTNANDWAELCDLWSSDYRTHITKTRWMGVKQQLSHVLSKYKIKSNNSFSNEKKHCLSLEELKDKCANVRIVLDDSGIFLKISTPKIEIEFNLRKGLTINGLAFVRHNMRKSVGTLPHGYFPSIKHGADYFSGGVVVELPIDRKRITDLKPVIPSFYLYDNGDIEVIATIQTDMGDICKVYIISSIDEHLSLSYDFIGWKKPVGSIRVGTMTLFPEFYDENVVFSCANGGASKEVFSMNEDMNHGAPSSTLVSTSGGVGATDGSISISGKNGKLFFRWLPEECAVMPLLQRESGLTRLMFSMLELDDTSKESNHLSKFKFTISSS